MKLPQLSLRELFLLVVIAAMGCGWWVDRSRLITSNAEGIRELMGWVVESGNDWREERRKLEAETKLWKYRAEAVANRVREDGYHVTWSGNWNDHTFQVQPPSKLNEPP